MKTNYFIRFVYTLFICVMLSTSITAKTYAKYITSDVTSDSARVAKWGVNIEMYGSLFGTDYNAASDNGIHVSNDEKTITVTSNNHYSLTSGSVVAPGTQNFEGLKIIVSGKPETAINFSGTIESQNIALKTNIYALMTRVAENLESEETYKKLLGDYGDLYCRVSKNENKVRTTTRLDENKNYTPIYDYVDGYIKINSYSEAIGKDIYFKSEVIEANNNKYASDNYHWPYCPLVFETYSIDNTNNSKLQIKYKTTSRIGNNGYWISRNDKSLDIIAAAFEYDLGGAVSWPEPGLTNKNTMERSFSQTLSANTDLNDALKINNRVVWRWEFNQYASDSPHYYVYPFDNSISKGSEAAFSMADTYLGYLAAEKQGLNLDSNNNPKWEVVIHNRSIRKFGVESTVFDQYLNKDGNYNIRIVGNWNKGGTNLNASEVNKLKDEWIIPVEYADYCLETKFNINLTISQAD